MKINLNKIYALLLWTLVLIVTLLLVKPSLNFTYAIWLKVFSGYSLTLLVCAIFIMHLTEIKVFSLSGFFLIATYIFHFGQTLLNLIAPHYRYSIVNYAGYLNKEYYKSASVFSLCIFWMVLLGMICTTKKKSFNIRPKRYDVDYQFSGYLILIICFPIKLGMDIYLFLQSSQKGYLAIFDTGFSGIINQISQFYIIGAILVLIANKDNKTKASMILMAFLAYNILSMLSGGRSRAVINVLLLIYVYLTVVNTITLKQIVKYGVLSYVLLIFLNTIAQIRDKGISSVSQLILEMFSIDNNPIFLALEEFGSTIYTVYRALVCVPDSIPYASGSTYINSICQILVNINGILDKSTDIAQFSSHLAVDNIPMGGSYIGELYYNFGNYISCIGGLLIGCFVNSVSNRIVFYLKNQCFTEFSYYIMAFVTIIWWVRAAFVDLPRAIIWGAILVWVVFRVSRKKIRYDSV